MFQRVFAELIQATGAAVVAVQLIRLMLVKRFPALFGYLLLLVSMDLAFSGLDDRSNIYFYSYVLLEPLKSLLSILAVRELFALTFEKYPGIRTAGRWAMYAGLFLAVSISLAVSPWTGGTHGSHVLFYFEVAQRWVIFTLAITLGVILWSLSRYPLHLPANTLRSSLFFSSLFLCDAARLLIDSLMPNLHSPTVDTTQSVFSGLCLFAWASMLRPAEETLPAVVTFSTPREDYLLQQLTAFNRMMTRAARR